MEHRVKGNREHKTLTHKSVNLKDNSQGEHGNCLPLSYYGFSAYRNLKQSVVLKRALNEIRIIISGMNADRLYSECRTVFREESL